MPSLTYTDVLTKLKYQSKANETTLVTQLVQDYNTGYQQFLAKLDRYFTRKQQFTNVGAGQNIYQTPIDCSKILLVTVVVGANYQPPLREVQTEEDWRALTAYPQTTQWPTHYFILGNKQISLWPTPSQAQDLGLRLVYQPSSYDLSIADITSVTTAATATLVNGSPTVTLSSSVLPLNQVSLSFQATGVLDNSFYDIGASTGSTITLVTPYAGPSVSGVDWRIGQVPILPPEYSDVPIHYALSLYFDLNGNPARATSHRNSFKQMTDDALEVYSSANESNVITEDQDLDIASIWRFPPPAV